jgi:MYXO-CTERM domain-containing protein
VAPASTTRAGVLLALLVILLGTWRRRSR